MRRQVRPFGANALLASYTEDGPQVHGRYRGDIGEIKGDAVDPTNPNPNPDQLYSIDTSGVSARFFATAMGKVRPRP